MRTHKVGTLTLGVVLVVFGMLFLIHLFGGLLSYHFIFSLWPIVFIALGAEVLLSLVSGTKTAFQLDGKAVFLMLILMLFAMVMAGFDLTMEWLADYGALYF